MRIVVPVGQISPLIAFSATLAGGNMGAGGGMGMGVASCNSNNGGSASSGMMGSSYGEGRALAVAALQSIGLSEANVVGTYNAAAELTTFSEAAGTVLVTSEIKYGTMTFNGAGNISGGNLFYKRNTMDVNNAINSGAPALTITSGNESVNGTYNVSAVNGNMTLSLNGLTTGTGFITPDAQFMAFPIEATASGSGSRGILYLLRQP